MSLDDKIDSTKDKVSGKAKEVEGKVTNDKTREAEGKGQGILGKAKDKLSDAKDAVKVCVTFLGVSAWLRTSFWFQGSVNFPETNCSKAQFNNMFVWD